MLQLAASPVHSVRTMAAKALVATASPAEHGALLLQLSARLPVRPARCCHNRLHGQLLQTRALLDAALSSARYALMRGDRAGRGIRPGVVDCFILSMRCLCLCG